MPDLTGMTKRQVHEKLRNLRIPWDPRGVGRVVSQSPAPGTPVSQGALCVVDFARGPLEVAETDTTGKETSKISEKVNDQS